MRKSKKTTPEKKKVRKPGAKARLMDLETEGAAGRVKGGDTTSATSGAGAGKIKFNEFQITK
jgi:hypothetical protein